MCIRDSYRIADEGNNVDSEIESYLYETLKPLLTQNITLATFIDRDNHTGGSIVSSQKVGPSIADDIKTGCLLYTSCSGCTGSEVCFSISFRESIYGDCMYWEVSAEDCST